MIGIVHKVNKNIILINNYANLLIGVVFFVLIGVSSSWGVFGPIREMGDLANFIKTSSPNHNNVLVVSDRMLFANLSYELSKTSTKIYTPYSPGAKIGHHFQLKNFLPIDINDNFIFIGYREEINYLKSSNTIKLLSNKNFSFANSVLKIYEVTF